MEIPIGFRFQPTDREIITDYLRPMVQKRRPQCEDVIQISNLYGEEALDISLIFEAGTRSNKYYDNEEDVLYFFTPLIKKYGKGTRIHRVAGPGTWTLQDGGKDIYDSERRVIGLKKHLSFTTYKQEEASSSAAPKKRKASSTSSSSNNISWIMHEYSLTPAASLSANPEIEYVICKIRRKGAKSSHSSSRRYAVEEVVDPIPVPAIADHAMMINAQPVSSPSPIIPSVIAPMLGQQYYNPSFNHMPAMKMIPRSLATSSIPLTEVSQSSMVEELVPAVPTTSSFMAPFVDQSIITPMVVDQQYYFNHMPTSMSTIMNDASLVPATSTISTSKFDSSIDTQTDNQTNPEELDDDLQQFCDSIEADLDEETDTQTDNQTKLEELDDDLLQFCDSIEENLLDEGDNAQPMFVYSRSTTTLIK